MTKNGSNILVAAAAGSGKTAVLVERIIHKIIDEKMDIDKILVVTFTNAAASEMRERILDAIYKKLEEEPQNTHLQRQLTLLPKASICTIHSFCLDVIHNYFYEIDLASNFRIADTVEIDLLKQEVLDDLFEQKYLENNSDFIELLETYTNYRGDEALQALILTIYRFMQSNPFPEKWLQEKLNLLTKNEEIKDFAETIWGKIILEYIKEEIEEAILRLQNMQSKMEGFYELSKFTQVIAADKIELQGIIDQIDCWDNTYLKIQNLHFSKWPTDKKVTLDLKEEAKQTRDNIKKTIKEDINKLINQNSKTIFADFERILPILEKLVNLVIEFGKLFAEKKREKNCIDFNDIEHFALTILLENPTTVAKKYQEKFIEIAIDEYQDSNLVQESILTSISCGNNIFMVGDVKQSIYKFRQARPELFLQKYQTYKLKEQKKENDHLKIQLFRNFRSRQNILEVTNLVFEAIMSKKLGDIDYNENEYLNYGANYPDLEIEKTKNTNEKIEKYQATDEKKVDQEKENHSITINTRATEMLIIDLKQQDEMQTFTNEIVESDTKKEEISEAHIEQEERIEDEVLEARMVANKIQELLKNNTMVYDRKKGYRPIKPKDIVILLRATSTLAPIYEKELADLEIPVYSDNSSSYLDSVEIQTILSILKIMDNPLQEIPLVVVLRSNIANFTDNDLLQIRLTDRNCNFYEALVKTRLCAEGNLKQKIEEFFIKLEKWKKQEQYKSLDELIWQIYLDTGYYQYVGLLPNGAMRQANLKTLFEKAKQYETASYKGLFHFVHFIEKLKKQNGDLASSKLIGENEDVVRIMSIHKSKGLEFPVVFLCNSQKRFNMQDLNENILLHQDLGIGPTFIDTKKKIKYSTLAKEAIKLQMKQETLSEEERILYVALTRAKEKLYITGRSKDFTKEIEQKKQELAVYLQQTKDLKFDDKLIRKGKSYLDWLFYVYLLGQEKIITLKGEEKVIDDIITLQSFSKKELLESLKNQQKEKKIDIIQAIQNKWSEISQTEENKTILTENERLENVQQELSKILEWQYSYLVDTKLPTKTSVTKIKEEKIKLQDINLQTEEDRKLENILGVGNFRKEGTVEFIKQEEKQEQEKTIEQKQKKGEEQKENCKNFSKRMPKFMQENKTISNAHKGTLVHLCIQRLKEEKEYTLQDIQEMIQELLEKQIITTEEAKSIDAKLVFAYTKSQLFQDLKNAKEIYKEQPFYISLPAKEIIKEAKEANSEKEILVQGIMDLFYINSNHQLILVDFKTDYIGREEGAKEKIVEKYKTQLEIYKRALEQALNRKVDKVVLCLANANWEEVLVF